MPPCFISLTWLLIYLSGCCVWLSVEYYNIWFSTLKIQWAETYLLIIFKQKLFQKDSDTYLHLNGKQWTWCIISRTHFWNYLFSSIILNYKRHHFISLYICGKRKTSKYLRKKFLCKFRKFVTFSYARNFL